MAAIKPKSKMVARPSSCKGGGKGFSGGGRNNVSKGLGKSAGKGGKPKAKTDSKYADKLAKIDASRKVWVGGLTEATTWKQLEEHFKTVAKPAVTEIMRKGKACIAFKTDEDAESAISSMNGTELEGNVIEVDVWTQKEKTEKPKREKGENTNGNKGNSKAKTDSKYADKLAKIDASRKVWVGGLTEATTWKQLEEHFKTVAKPSVTEIMRKGKACIAFKTDEDAESAISSMNGTELEGNVIEVDVWTQKEKTEKPEREKGENTNGKKKMKLLTKFGNKSAKTQRSDPKLREKMDQIDSSLKVWVGGLADTTSASFLRKHFTDEGCKPHFTNLSGKVNACVAFKTEDEVQSAISTMNGTTLDGQAIEVDVWTQPEKREKK